MAVSLRDVTGSTVNEFMQNAGAIFGAGVLGETKPSLELKWKATNGAITSATLTLTITSRTAHWSGPGASKVAPDAANRDAINRIEALNKAHEQRHIDTFQSTFDAKRADIEKKYVGVMTTATDAVTSQMTDALTAACETLHSTEGLIDVVRQGNTFTITVKPQGPGGCT